VIGYVDKQVRKELLEAMRMGDLSLLRNYALQFKKSLASQINLRPEPAGNTVLHHALLMDFETGTQLIDLDDSDQNDMKLIKKALAKESSKSLNVKAEVMHYLCVKGAGDASLSNHYQITPHDIAKHLRENTQILRYMAGKPSLLSAIFGKKSYE